MTENGTAPAPPDEDRTPTQSDEAPLVKPAEQWVMPEPVFRRSDGFTPRPTVGNEDTTITPDSVSTLEIDAGHESEISAGSVPGSPLIAEQPDVIADDASQPIGAVTVTPKKGGFMRLLLMILGITIIAIVVGALITGVVLWYIFQASESQNLN